MHAHINSSGNFRLGSHITLKCFIKEKSVNHFKKQVLDASHTIFEYYHEYSKV